jgi:tetratricopeptide (TPR) repeat protein
MGNDQATLAGQLAQEALAENEAAIMVSPNNVNYWKTRTKILSALSGLDPGFVSSAITALKHAFTLSPNDPKIAYNLAILYARSGDQSSAIDYFIQAKTLKPDYHDAYKGLYLYYTEIKQPEKAKAVLTDYLTHVDAADIEFTKLLKDK